MSSLIWQHRCFELGKMVILPKAQVSTYFVLPHTRLTLTTGYSGIVFPEKIKKIEDLFPGNGQRLFRARWYRNKQYFAIPDFILEYEFARAKRSLTVDDKGKHFVMTTDIVLSFDDLMLIHMTI